VDSGFSEQRHDRPDDPLAASQTVVLVVDMLNDFLETGGSMVVPGATRLYQPVNDLTRVARAAGGSVVWVCDRHDSRDDAEFAKRKVHCLDGTWGAELAESLTRLAADRVVCKRRYSGFFGTDLDLRLREIGARHLVVCGVVTNICVRSTVHDAFFLGYDVIVPSDCVAATSPREQESSLYDIDTHFGTVWPLDKTLMALAGPAAVTARGAAGPASRTESS
jgi:ureidoacrylate peracid hydrolase